MRLRSPMANATAGAPGDVSLKRGCFSPRQFFITKPRLSGSKNSRSVSRGRGSRRLTRKTTGNSRPFAASRSEEHTSELQSLAYLVCRLLLEKKKKYHD